MGFQPLELIFKSEMDLNNLLEMRYSFFSLFEPKYRFQDFYGTIVSTLPVTLHDLY